MHSLSILGTSSDAGKSTMAFALSYLLHQEGFSVAPFKAQNVSNNAVACDLGGEIAQAQDFAAQAMGLATRSDFNPVLLKSGSGNHASVIINGIQVASSSVKDYYHNLDQLKPVVKDAFLRLQEGFDIIVAEGAGSPVELNLMDKDLSNIYIADTFNTKIVLIADIERGGVFASIWGVYNLLPEKLRNNIVGVIINKFRGDKTLFDEGKTIIESRFGIKVLGVVEYLPFNLGFEDSQSLINYTQNKQAPKIRIGVIQFPHISNFTDFEPLMADSEVLVSFISDTAQVSHFDMLILPGTKRTIDDLRWLKSRGFEKVLEDFKGTIVALCGGYQMMFESISDPLGIESVAGTKEAALHKVRGEVLFEASKCVRKQSYTLFGIDLKGYEIHNGSHEKLFTQSKNFYGTFVHGIFDSDALRMKFFSEIDPMYKGFDFAQHKQEAISAFAQHVNDAIDMPTIIKALHE